MSSFFDRQYAPKVVLVILIGVILGTTIYATRDNDNYTSPSIPSYSTSELTQGKAQKTLSKWKGSKGSVSVGGVQNKSDNSAVVQFTLTDFEYNAYEGHKTYSGPGEATFVHYNDGRWVLSKIVIGRGIPAAWFNDINLEVQ